MEEEDIWVIRVILFSAAILLTAGAGSMVLTHPGLAGTFARLGILLIVGSGAALIAGLLYLIVRSTR